MYAPSYVWAKVIGHLEQVLSDITVSAWFDDAQVMELTDEKLTVYSPSDFRREIIRRRCASYIREYLQEFFGRPMEFEVWGQPEMQAQLQKKKAALTANPQFTFETFIPGASNKMALGVAKAVAQSPGQERYNPFFLYGPPGVGKTHLLYAIAGHLQKERPEMKVTYIRAEQFTSELIWALRNGEKEQFKEKFRGADVLLVDDIQFIAGKESTQEEFFNTFNALFERGKQIVISSDRRPCDMATLEDRLRSRFDSAVPIEIGVPDYATRLAVVRNKAKSYGLALEEKTMAYIAATLSANIRQVEGGMKKLRAFHDLNDTELTYENVCRIIEDVRRTERESPVTPELVLRHVCKYYGLDEDTLRGPQRTRNVALPRQIAMHLIRKLVGTSIPQIAAAFHRDNATVLHALKKVEAELRLKDNKLEAVIRDITSNIESTPC